jgi:hypothetical protein
MIRRMRASDASVFFVERMIRTLVLRPTWLMSLAGPLNLATRGDHDDFVPFADGDDVDHLPFLGGPNARRPLPPRCRRYRILPR